MVTEKVNTLVFELDYSVPSTVAEFDTLAKKDGACLEAANANVKYRSVFAKFRSLFAEAVENNTGIVRLTEPTGKMVKDEAGNDTTEPQTRFTETDKVYFNRVGAELVKAGKFDSIEAAQASFQSLAQTTLDTIAFDPSESEAKPSQPRKVAKAYITLAEKAQAAGKLDALAQTLAAKLVNWHVDATVDSVAKAVAEDQRRKREATKLDAEYNV